MTAEKSTGTETTPMLSSRALTVPGVAGTWVVVECFSRHEKTIAADIAGAIEQGADFGYFLPLVRTTKLSGRKRFTTYAPIPALSGYLFAASPEPLEAGYHVPRGLHQFLTAHRSVFDLIEVHPGAQATLVRELTELHGAIVNTPNFGDRFTLKGKTCRVTGGPYIGHEGVITDQNEGYALLPITMLGQQVPTPIDVRLLEPI